METRKINTKTQKGCFMFDGYILDTFTGFHSDN